MLAIAAASAPDASQPLGPPAGAAACNAVVAVTSASRFLVMNDLVPSSACCFGVSELQAASDVAAASARTSWMRMVLLIVP